MGTLLHNCGEVREPIELSVGMVNGVGGGMGVLDGVYVPEGNGQFWGFIDPVGFNRVFFNKKKCIQLVRDKFRVFPYRQYIVGIVGSVAQIQPRNDPHSIGSPFPL